ncbi:MAG: 30S ribosome-binding factor RbfA [Candidatus Omnitrophota bacterium]
MLDRMDRVSEAIKREISLILQEKVNDPRLSSVSITRVEVSRDLKNAKVYYLGLPDEAEQREIEKALNKAAKFIRSELAGRVTIKFTPRLIFTKDKAEEMEESIEKTFDIIEKELEEKSEHEKGTEDEK